MEESGLKDSAWREFFRRHPVLCLWWLLIGLLEMLGIGLFGGVLVFGWCNQGLTWPTFTLGVTLALLVGWLRVQQRSSLVREERGRARSLNRWLTWPLVTVIILLLTVSGVELWQNGLLPLSHSRQAELIRLFTVLEKNYPYFDYKQLDWQSMQSEYRPRLEAAVSDQELLSILDEFLASFHDLHTGVLNPSPLDGWRGFLAVREIGGQAVVSAVRQGLERPGLAPGAIIERRNGQTIEQFVASLPPSLRSSSTPWSAENGAWSLLGAAPEGESLRLTYQGVDGQSHTEDLQWLEQFNQSSGTPRPRISSQVLPDGIGLITVKGLNGGLDFIHQIDRALNELLDAPGIILDLRQNGGGNSLLGDAIAGRFLAKPFSYGHEYFRQRLPWRAWATQMTYRVQPRGQTYSGPLAVLTSANTASSAEMLTVALRDAGRATVIGQTTAGGSGNPISFGIAGGRVRFSTGDFRRMDGSPIEGVGIVPDLPVSWTVDDLTKGIDPDLTAANEWIADQLSAAK
jgi:carboxyl-terminal processing protease